MKLAVDFMAYEDAGDEDVRLTTNESFNFDENDEEALTVIQTVIDRYEEDGLTIDQGGDDEWYELNLPDGCDQSELADFRVNAEKLLQDVTVALRAIGR